EQYTDVMANLQRNDLQESLRDLGPDSAYADGQQIDPDVEAAHDSDCKPLPDWQFTLGAGKFRGVAGPWGLLSVVTDPFPTQIVTQDHTALLNNQGEATGRQILGAITVPLPDAEEALSGTPQTLWVQGGTPEDPILNDTYPGNYGFAALRCGVDNL